MIIVKRNLKRVKTPKQTMLVFVIIFALIGAIALLATHAASPYGSSQAETGTLASGAATVSDVNASGGSFVKFGSGSSSALSIRVSGNKLVNGSGVAIVPRGVNRSGTEYACSEGFGFFDGPNDLASIQAMETWHVHIVRLGLNEDCWLGINGINPSFSGALYQQQIVNYVNLLNSQGIYAILELHISAPGTTPSINVQYPMPDLDHTPTFWQQVATTFKNNPAVIFDLFNEPFPNGNSDTTAAWTCWRDGSGCTGMTTNQGTPVSYSVAGMQTLVNAVRGTGSTNIMMLGGVQFSNSLSQWLAFKPNDPANQLVASDHNYPNNICTSQTCWDTQMGTVSQLVPVIIGETGDNTCSPVTYVNSLLPWADSKGIGYLGWVWDAWGACQLVLIQDYNGTPTVGWGQFLHDHLITFP